MFQDSNLSSDGTGSESDSDIEPNNLLMNLIHSILPNFQRDRLIERSVYCGGRGRSRLPRIKPACTNILDASDFSQITRNSSTVLDLKRKVPSGDKNIASLITNRETGLFKSGRFSNSARHNISNIYLPNWCCTLDNYSGKVFCGIHSKDGERFITVSQDQSIRIFDSSKGYKFLFSIQARDVGWSIIDVAFSPNREHFIYSTWSSDLHLYSAREEDGPQENLTLLTSGRRFCIFSVAFSSDGREILGGASDNCLYIYDLPTHQRILKIPAHKYDVNTVCYADDSSQIIYSAGDDAVIKVWDRRTWTEHNPTPVGVLAGHTDGITYIDSRGDGRHLISNSKDQSIKLWDVRVFSAEKAVKRSLQAVVDQNWDYRWQEVPKNAHTDKVDGDTSLMTYRGHIVVKTLIRCRFSPAEITGQRYIYTGCGSGRIVVYDSLTGAIVRSINKHKACVRDVDWHPKRNDIVSSSWDGTIALTSYMKKESLSDGDECSRNSGPVRRSSRIAKQRREKQRQQGT